MNVSRDRHLFRIVMKSSFGSGSRLSSMSSITLLATARASGRGMFVNSEMTSKLARVLFLCPAVRSFVRRLLEFLR